MTDQLKGLIITFFGVLFVIPDSYFIRVIEAPATVVFFWRSLLQGLVIGVGLFLLQGRRVVAEGRSLGWPGLAYAACLGVSSLCFVASVKYTTVANTVFIIATIPVFAAISSWLLMGEAVSKRMRITFVFALIGVLVIAYGSFEEGPNGQSTLFGDLLALGAALTFSTAISISRSIAPATIIPMVPVGYLGAALVVMPFISPFNIPDGQWIYVILHGGFFVAISALLLALGPKYLRAAEVGLLILLESALAPLLVWWLLDEVPSNYALIGGVIVLLTLGLSNLIAVMRPRKSA